MFVYRSFPKITPLWHFAQECQTDGALRARTSNRRVASRKNVLILGASRQNGRKNHSLKEEWTSAALAPWMSVPPSMSDFFDHLPKLTLLREAPHPFDILARSRPHDLKTFLREAPHDLSILAYNLCITPPVYEYNPQIGF